MWYCLCPYMITTARIWSKLVKTTSRENRDSFGFYGSFHKHCLLGTLSPLNNFQWHTAVSLPHTPTPREKKTYKNTSKYTKCRRKKVKQSWLPALWKQRLKTHKRSHEQKKRTLFNLIIQDNMQNFKEFPLCQATNITATVIELIFLPFSCLFL